MANSTVVEWLNENSLRSYPLISGCPRYAYSGKYSCDLYVTIVDALLVYASRPDIITLETITTAGSTLTITVTGQSPFVLNNYTSAHYPYYLRNSTNSLIVIGDVSTLPSNVSFTVNTEFEFSTVLEIPASMLGLSSLKINDTTLTGSVILNEGYQLSLVPDTDNVRLEVGRNEGNPLPCISVRGVVNDCDTVVSTINGVKPQRSGKPIKFVAGNNVKIFEDPDNNRIYVGLNFTANEVPVQVLPTPSKII